MTTLICKLLANKYGRYGKKCYVDKDRLTCETCCSRISSSHLKGEFHGSAHAPADRRKNKLYGSTLNSMRVLACSRLLERRAKERARGRKRRGWGRGKEGKKRSL